MSDELKYQIADSTGEVRRRVAEVADQADMADKAIGAIAAQQQEDGKSIASHGLRISQAELEIQKMSFRIEQAESRVEGYEKFKRDAYDKMGGLQRLGAAAACLAMLDLIINFLQIGGVV